jgi:uncharacterized DUF497 family protein
MFEWDEKKNRINLEKHGIGFALVVRFLKDRFCPSWMIEMIMLKRDTVPSVKSRVSLSWP